MRHRTHASRRAVSAFAAVALIAVMVESWAPSVAHAQRIVSDEDVARVLPMLRSPLGRPAGVYSAMARGESGFKDYAALTAAAQTPAFDPQAYIAANSSHAVIPDGARYLRACSQQQPIAAVKLSDGTSSDVFTPTAVHALAGNAGSVAAAQRFYAQAGFATTGPATASRVRMMAPDRSVLVTISRANPLVMDAVFNSPCSNTPGPVVELALYRDSWSGSAAGWTRDKYEAELARHGLESREYTGIVSNLRVTRAIMREPDWAGMSEYERDLVAPNWRVYLKHRERLDPLLDLWEGEPLR